MNLMETAKIMAVLETAYPMFYAKKTQQEREDAIRLWAEMFADEPGELVAMAVKALIKSRISTFPPGIGEITEKIQQITQPDEMTELEAWSLVAKAVSNSAYNSGEEFRKLPPVVQRLVGLFYNGGATLTTEGSASLEDLKSLEAQGVEILTCGTCLNYYGLTEKLAVGSVTNMYSIVEILSAADKVIKP